MSGSDHRDADDPRRGGGMTSATAVSCGSCGREVALIDENGRCEKWHIKTRNLVCDPLIRLEEFVESGLEHGMTPDQFRRALEMSLAGAEGPLLGTQVRREACDGMERGVWLEPDSSFDNDHTNGPSPRNRWAWAHLGEAES
jgi:hypothetical protein